MKYDISKKSAPAMPKPTKGTECIKIQSIVTFAATKSSHATAKDPRCHKEDPSPQVLPLRPGVAK